MPCLLGEVGGRGGICIYLLLYSSPPFLKGPEVAYNKTTCTRTSYTRKIKEGKKKCTGAHYKGQEYSELASKEAKREHRIGDFIGTEILVLRGPGFCWREK